MRRAETVLDLIGSTPVLKLGRLTPKEDAIIWAKLESFNPGGSIKDRICLSMIEAAGREGKIPKGTTIVEPTSGNTGISLALVCAVKGYRLILTMPETVSPERKALLAAYGAELELTPGKEGMRGAIRRAEEINDLLVDIKKTKGWDIPLHVDGSRGAFVAPFVDPDLEWDFRLEQVKSINASGHKYGLVYPGIGWLVMKDKNDLPEELVFRITYLGGGDAELLPQLL